MMATSTISLGLGTIVTDGYGRKNPEGFAGLLQAAADAGISTVDTAAAYGAGESERLLGSAMRDLRLNFRVCTKIGITGSDASSAGPGNWIVSGGRESLWRQAEASLARLNIDRAEYIFLHRPDPHVSIQESMTALLEIREAGLTNRIGFCNLGDVDALSVLREGFADAVQAPWSLVDRRAEPLLHAAGHRGLTRMAFGALAFGILAGSVRRATVFDPDDWRGLVRTGHKLKTNGAPLFEEPAFSTALAQADCVDEMARSRGLSMAAATVALSVRLAPAEQVIVGCRDASELSELAAGLTAHVDGALVEQGRQMAVLDRSIADVA